MKKYILSIVALIMTLVFMPSVRAEEKVPVYVFTKEGCSACASAQEYFTELSKEHKGLFELVVVKAYDSKWKPVSDDAKNLVVSVYDYFKEDSESIATPTIVIGDYHTIGLPNDTTEVYNAIVSLSESEEKTDVVKTLADKLGINLDDISTVEISEKDNSKDGLIIGIIFGVIILGFGGLVLYSRKK